MRFHPPPLFWEGLRFQPDSLEPHARTEGSSTKPCSLPGSWTQPGSAPHLAGWRPKVPWGVGRCNQCGELRLGVGVEKVGDCFLPGWRRNLAVSHLHTSLSLTQSKCCSKCRVPMPAVSVFVLGRGGGCNLFRQCSWPSPPGHRGLAAFSQRRSMRFPLPLLLAHLSS